MEGQTDGHTTTAYTALAVAQRRAVKISDRVKEDRDISVSRRQMERSLVGSSCVRDCSRRGRQLITNTRRTAAFHRLVSACAMLDEYQLPVLAAVISRMRTRLRRH